MRKDIAGKGKDKRGQGKGNSCCRPRQKNGSFREQSTERCRGNEWAKVRRHTGDCYRVPPRISAWTLEASWGWVWEIGKKGRKSVEVIEGWSGELADWLAALQRGKKLRYCSKADKMWCGWWGWLHCESKGWNEMETMEVSVRDWICRESGSQNVWTLGFNRCVGSIKHASPSCSKWGEEKGVEQAEG